MFLIGEASPLTFINSWVGSERGWGIVVRRRSRSLQEKAQFVRISNSGLGREPSSRYRRHEGSSELSPRRTQLSDGDTHSTVVILDYGSQYTQLITRRVRELGFIR